MQFTHGRIALLAIVTGFEMVYLSIGILIILGGATSEDQNPPCLKTGCFAAGLIPPSLRLHEEQTWMYPLLLEYRLLASIIQTLD